MKDKILIYRLGSLGDTIIALPCFNKIIETFPNSEITILTNAPVSSSAAPIANILSPKIYDRIITYPIGLRNPIVFFRLLKRIYVLKIDTLFYLTEARSPLTVFRDTIFFKLLGIKNIIGLPKKESDFKVEKDSESNFSFEWEAKRLTKRLTQFIGDIDLNNSKNWELFLTENENQKAKIFLKNYAKGPLLTICTGTKFNTNDWGINNWKYLLSLLKSRLKGWKLIIVGGPEDILNGNECLDVWGGEGLNLCGLTEVRVSACIIKRANLFIGHDSGPLHLASCVGTHSIGIYSGRNKPGQWFPRKNNNKVIYHSTSCSGCGLIHCLHENKKCILSITPEEVLKEVEILLSTVNF
ncbi:glycosyltransferase family 9 protein [Runella limosa]|jgi:ADP-heptose:LPS heptosyltransferase|uniref:glycosyltransferase family 9 protein n=1 Tax=Runella limosa TaxID=370978 RepID=UPI0003FF3A1A|nr:glycosyltransferase family 9 protein [Runella limosa]